MKYQKIAIKKTIKSRYGAVEVDKSHTFCRTPYGFQMSPYLQDLVVFTGQNHVFEDASEQLKKLSGLDVTAKQVERLTHAYGELLDINAGQIEEEVSVDESLHYCMMDGAMLLTREDDWKEIKLARVFEATSHMSESEKRNFIKNSTYTAHLGSCKPFFSKLEKTTDRLKNMVWIADGAKWIWNWVDSSYPDSIQILDYYHCIEKLHGFAKEALKNPEQRREWVEDQQNLLMQNEAKVVIANISLMNCKGKTLQLQRTLLTYYENNLKRMKYKTYKQEGLLIGSGPMEAAHRHVIQHRMKLSGQRWTINGAQQVANLRVANKSGKWKNVLNLINLN